MYLKLLIVTATLAHAMDISDPDRDNSEPYLKQGKLDFGTSHEVVTVPKDSHETESEFNDSDKHDSVPIAPVSDETITKTQTDRKVDPIIAGDDEYHKLHSTFHRYFQDHGLDFDHEFRSHTFDNAPESKDIGGFHTHIDDQMSITDFPSFGDDQEKHSVETGINLGSGSFGTFAESGLKKSHYDTEGFLRTLSAENSKENHQESFKRRMSRNSRDLESINTQRRNGREEHNLRDLQRQRKSNNEYLDAILSDNKRKFDTESENRQTFSKTARTQSQIQNSGCNTEHERTTSHDSGFSQRSDSSTGFTNNFDRKDGSDTGILGDNTRRKSQSDHHRRRINQESDSNYSNRRTDDMNANRQRHRKEHRTHDERHSIRHSSDSVERNTSNGKTSYSIPVASQNDGKVNNKQDTNTAISRMNQSNKPESEDSDKEVPKATRTGSHVDKKDQRPHFMTTTDRVMLSENKKDDGENDEWIWSKQGDKSNITLKESGHMNSTALSNGDGNSAALLNNNVNSTVVPNLDDRAAFNGDRCPSGRVKVGNMCVETD